MIVNGVYRGLMVYGVCNGGADRYKGRIKCI